MFRRPPKFVATPEAPFENDKLGREDSIRNLTTLMEGTDTPMVMTVSAPWGSGKSSFVKMWKAYLESGQAGKKHPCIMFDAWKHDFHKEPLLAIMGEIGAFIAENSVGKKGEEALKKAMKVLPKLFKASAGMAYAASFFVPGMGAVKEVLDKSADAIKKVDDYVFEEHSSQKKRLEIFKAELEKFVQIVTNDGTNGPLYFFVDELDRCDPEYAIRLLESVKHFFDVEGIVFVLSVDRKRLGSMVRVRYGEGFDEDGYLKRFVDLDYSVQEPDSKELIDYLCKDVLRLKEIEICNTEQRYEDFLKFTSELAFDFKLRARDLEKVFIKIYPLLRQSFNLIDEGGTIEGLLRYEDSVVYGLGVQRSNYWVRCPDECGDMFFNFYYPLVFLAFLKEVSRKHYEQVVAAYRMNGQNQELRMNRPHSQHIGWFIEFISNTNREMSMLKQAVDSIQNRHVNPIENIVVVIQTIPKFWEQKLDEYCKQIDSLDNITLLASDSDSPSNEPDIAV